MTKYSWQSLALITGLAVSFQTTPSQACDTAHRGSISLSSSPLFELKKDPTLTPYGKRKNVKALVPTPPSAQEARAKGLIVAGAYHEVWFGENDAVQVEVSRIYQDGWGNFLGNQPGPDNVEILVWKTHTENGKLSWQLVVDPKTGNLDNATTIAALQDLQERIRPTGKQKEKSPSPLLLRVQYGEATNQFNINRTLSGLVCETVDVPTADGQRYLKDFGKFLIGTIELGNQLLPQSSLSKAPALPASSIGPIAMRRGREYCKA